MSGTTNLAGLRRQDYPNFEGWLKKCKLEQRPTWIVRGGESDPLSAVCIIKKQDDELASVV